MKTRTAMILALLPWAVAAFQQEDSPQDFDSVLASVHAELKESTDELSALRTRIADEKIPLSQRLSELEGQLIEIKGEYSDVKRTLDKSTFGLTKLTGDIKLRRDEATYLSTNLGTYTQNFESRLHIAELQHYEELLEEAKLAPENQGLSEVEIFEKQTELLTTSLDRMERVLGGARFDGRALDPEGIVRKGKFAMVGPSALFRSEDGLVVGTVEQRIGSLEPNVLPFATPENTAAAAEFVATGSGIFPFDPTGGDAHKVEGISETVWEHIQKGGAVMAPILAMAAASLLVALLKWLSLLFVRKPSKKQITRLLDAVGKNDEEQARAAAANIPGPAGRMLYAGVEHIHEPRDLVEEVMYERVLTSRLRLERFLPFVAICAAASPLLGLLGTVTGIIDTFKLITIFGSGDVKTLSGGISAALITTEFGLIVAIPSLLFHAFLSRKVRGVIGQMESTAVAFANAVSKSSFGRRYPSSGGDDGFGPVPDPDHVRSQVQSILEEMLNPLVGGGVQGGVVDPAPHPARGSSEGRRLTASTD